MIDFRMFPMWSRPEFCRPGGGRNKKALSVLFSEHLYALYYGIEGLTQKRLGEIYLIDSRSIHDRINAAKYRRDRGLEGLDMAREMVMGENAA